MLSSPTDTRRQKLLKVFSVRPALTNYKQVPGTLSLPRPSADMLNMGRGCINNNVAWALSSLCEGLLNPSDPGTHFYLEVIGIEGYGLAWQSTPRMISAVLRHNNILHIDVQEEHEIRYYNLVSDWASDWLIEAKGVHYALIECIYCLLHSMHRKHKEIVEVGAKTRQVMLTELSLALAL